MIEVNPMGCRESLTAFFQSFPDDVYTVIVLRANRADGIPQKVPCTPTEIEHQPAAPIGIVQLSVEIGELA
jgi:hypothetical protein